MKNITNFHIMTSPSWPHLPHIARPFLLSKWKGPMSHKEHKSPPHLLQSRQKRSEGFEFILEFCEVGKNIFEN